MNIVSYFYTTYYRDNVRTQQCILHKLLTKLQYFKVCLRSCDFFGRINYSVLFMFPLPLIIPLLTPKAKRCLALTFWTPLSIKEYRVLNDKNILQKLTLSLSLTSCWFVGRSYLLMDRYSNSRVIPICADSVLLCFELFRLQSGALFFVAAFGFSRIITTSD